MSRRANDNDKKLNKTVTINMKNSYIRRVIVLYESNSVGTFLKDGIHLFLLCVSFAVFI